MALTHSYSGIKDFQGCGRRYHQVRILRKYKQTDTTATLYGTAVHKAFEEYLMHRTPLPETFQHFENFVLPLSKFSGDIQCEAKLGVRQDFTPCGFFDKEVWFRGVPDFMALDHAKGIARVADFKTGKSSRFADTSQLELMAAMIMAHHPTINKVKGALLFVVAGSVIKSEYTREDLPEIWSKWAGAASMIQEAMDNGVWNAHPSGLCKFCPLPGSECEHR